MYLFALDTSAKMTSVCLLKDQTLVAEYFLNANFTHSQTIMPMCENLLKQCHVSASCIDVFAVSHGPGSFTGLRIGISAVKGLAYATDKPCVSVSTLHAIALGAPAFDGVLCCVMDARCGQVYHACYAQQDNQRQRLTPDQAIAFEDLKSRLDSYQKPILLIGDGAALCYQQWKNTNLDLRLAPENIRYQTASSVAFAALQHIDQGGAMVSAAQLMPQYLRLPQAQRQLLARTLQADRTADS